MSTFVVFTHSSLYNWFDRSGGEGFEWFWWRGGQPYHVQCFHCSLSRYWCKSLTNVQSGVWKGSFRLLPCRIHFSSQQVSCTKKREQITSKTKWIEWMPLEKSGILNNLMKSLWRSQVDSPLFLFLSLFVCWWIQIISNWHLIWYKLQILREWCVRYSTD